MRSYVVLSRFVVGTLSVGLVVLGAHAAFGQDYPNKAVRIVTAAAGGSSDFDSRLIAQGIAGPLGQPVIVDNRPSLLAAEFLSKAPPDGYTLFVGGSGLWIRQFLEKMPYDMVRDFLPISIVTRTVWIVAVHPSVPVKSIKELIALAKARPGDLNYGASSIGGAPHLAAELFKTMAGVNIVHIAYTGNTATITALIRGEVQLTFLDVGLLAPHVKSGKLKALAVTSAEPSALAPGLPTVAASGLPGYESIGITGVFAPAKTPVTIVNRLNQEIVRLLNRPDMKEKFLDAGEEVVANSPEQAATFIKSDMAKWSKVISDAGIKIN